MLIRLEELVRVGGVFEEAIPLAINPLLIDTLRPEESLSGYEGDLCRMETQEREEPTFVSGGFPAVFDVINGGDHAIGKLRAIAEIASGEPQV